MKHIDHTRHQTKSPTTVKMLLMNYCYYYFLLTLILSLLLPQKAGSLQVSRSVPRVTTQLFATPFTEILPSVYDKSLPAVLRGEAVRSALRSDRGVFVDFTSSSCSLKNVGVVKVSGQGTPEFLNSKLSNSFSKEITGERKIHNINSFEIVMEKGEMKEAGILNSKGHVIDLLTTCSFATDDGIETYAITSPGHSGSQLFERLDRFIFPLDRVKLLDVCPSGVSSRSRVFTFIASEDEIARRSLRDSVLPTFKDWKLESFFSLPSRKGDCIRYILPKTNGGSIELVVLEQNILPSSIAKGYTLLIRDLGDDQDLGLKVLDRCTAEDNNHGPIAIGPLEYETLRIEGGHPAFGFEMTGHLKDSENGNKQFISKASPLELHLDYIVDQDKGCYQGQEGVAALLKNKRGVPRLLYSVIFPDECNTYAGDNQEDDFFIDNNNSIPNETKLPKVGDTLYALGSNKQIKVGTLTSVAERGGTSNPETVALGLVLRAQTILKKMKDMDLEIERDFILEFSSSNELESGIIIPPPSDPLDGLQVVLENGMTRGYLRAIVTGKLQNKSAVESDMQNRNGNPSNSLRFEKDSVKESQVEDVDIGGLNMKNNDSSLDGQAMKEVAGSKSEQKQLNDADTLAEIRRKSEKLEMLKKRAEEAMNRRQKKKD